MVPPDDARADDVVAAADGLAAGVVVIAAFRLEDVRRLHTLLSCYESPFVTSAEAGVRRVDLAEVERLRRYVRSLLDDLPVRSVVRLS